MGLLLLLLPLAAVLLFAVVPKKIMMDWINILASLAMLGVGLVLTGRVLSEHSVTYPVLGSFFHVDALSMVMLDMVLFVGFLAGLYSTGYLKEELSSGRLEPGRVRSYYMLMYSFIFTMILVLTVKNMGIMWIGIEATTLSSAFLVGFHNSRKAVEAAWKYVIICSVGIAVALLGIIFLQLSYADVQGLKDLQLDWTALYANADRLKTSVLKLAFIFILVGFGTKAGLAPMHTWLPDAHSQAPSPISALLSGVLLNSALYAVIRTVAVLNRNMGSAAYSGKLLIAFGLLSMVVASVFIITQKDYKRLLAYSSIEHMGIIAVSLGIFSPASILAGIYHMVNHSLTKSMLFLASGNVLLKYDTREILRVRGVLRALPVSGTAMLLGLFAITGTPPFSVFSSKFGILVSFFQGGKYVLGAAVILVMALVFIGTAVAVFKMFFPGDNDSCVKPGEQNIIGAFVTLLLLVAISVTGLYIPDEMRELLTGARKIIMGVSL